MVTAASVGTAVALGVATAIPAHADGPAPCSVGGPPFPYAGFCATYSGANTWYGSYGPGFPTPQGWGFCADPPASGGDYPAPDYDYVASAPPTGANTVGTGALGFAFSEAQALGWWGGLAGQFTADQAAVAGKLLYDSVVWSSPVPAMDPGVLAAYQALDSWYSISSGATGAPQLSGALLGGGTSFTGQATYQVSAVFPGTGDPVAGLPIELTASGANLGRPSGPTTLAAATDASGHADFTVVATMPGAVTLTASAPGGLGQPGLSFLAPSQREPSAQQLVAFASPIPSSLQANLVALPTTGTLSIVKAGDDSAYYPVGGAVFTVAQGSTVVATLTTGADGTSPPSAPLPSGTYTVHEETAPPGYTTAPDQTVSVVAGTNTEVMFTSAEEDHVEPATLTITKSDLATGAPLAGATFDIAYDAADDGTYRDIGNCTTAASGTCSPPGNDGPSLLPGRYRITEVAPPPGFAPATPNVQNVDLLAGEQATIGFGDPKLVSAVFQKVTSGNVNPAELALDGALIEVDQGTPGGPSVATCTTNPAGTCTTPAVLSAGTRYCWVERAAPPGLASGANGCFTADNAQADQPITVTDPGEFVAIEVRKVDAASPSVGLAGATFSLYRVTNPVVADGSSFVGAAGSAHQTLVATVTTGAGGSATFPLQLPGYAYCAVEVQAPPNYVADPDSQCTTVLQGSPVVPAPVTTLTFGDVEQTVTLQVFKYNSLTPFTGIPGATYDLYVEGALPPSGATGTVPADAAAEPGDTWYARGSTGADGRLSFTVPAGYSWCVHEVRAPIDYAVDPGLHCSAVLTTTSPSSATTIAIGETLATVHVAAYKYNSLQPSTVIPGATYEILADGARPPGAPETVPSDAVVPPGDAFFAEGTTNADGVLSFAVPAGYAWCLHELAAPPDYQPDPAYHCTAVLTTDSSAAAATVAVPETPLTGNLPFTGFPALWVGGVGGTLVAAGAGWLAVDRRRRGVARRRAVTPRG